MPTLDVDATDAGYDFFRGCRPVLSWRLRQAREELGDQLSHRSWRHLAGRLSLDLSDLAYASDPGEGLDESMASRLAGRLDRTLVNLNLPAPVWARLCDLLCPEEFGQPDPPAEPTEHSPGAVGKTVVLEDRCQRGVGLWHAADTLTMVGKSPTALPTLDHEPDRRRGGDHRGPYGSRTGKADALSEVTL